MTIGTWKKFIQINIYDRTLKELINGGVDLTLLMNEIGCSKHWITEGSLFSGETDSGNDSMSSGEDSDDTIPLFSNTTVITKLPRCSTPKTSKMERKFTFNATRPISKIFVDDEDSDIFVRNRTDTDELIGQFDMEIIKDLMDDMIWEVESEIAKENRLRTVMNMKRAALGTKNRSKSVQFRQVKEEDIRKDINVQKEISSPQVILDFPLKVTNRLRENLKRTMSEFKRGRKKAMRLLKKKSIHPLLTKEPTPVELNENNDQTTYYPSTSFTDPQRMESEKVYTELTPLTSDAESTSAQTLNNYFESIGTLPMSTRWSRDVTSDDDWADATEGIGRFSETLRIDEAPLPQLDTSVHFEDYGQDYDDQYDNYQDDTKIVEEGIEEENVGMDKELEEEEEEKEDDIDEEEEAGPSTSTRKSILTRKRTTNASMQPSKTQPSKKVSFAVRLIPANKELMTAAEYKQMVNETHLIKCEFKECKSQYKWKIKYGKLRLLDHALTHMPERMVKCHKCTYITWNTRQIRHHYSLKHPDTPLEGYGMLEVINFSMQTDEVNIQKVWRRCYKSNLDVVGEASLDRHTRKARKRNEESDNSSCDEGRQPVSNFYFSRIC